MFYYVAPLGLMRFDNITFYHRASPFAWLCHHCRASTIFPKYTYALLETCKMKSFN